MNTQEVCTGLSGTRAGLSAERKKLVQTLRGGAVKRKSSLDTGLSGRRFRPRRGCGPSDGGGSGIRTHEGRSDPTDFRDQRLKPLGHPSERVEHATEVRPARQHARCRRGRFSSMMIWPNHTYLPRGKNPKPDSRPAPSRSGIFVMPPCV